MDAPGDRIASGLIQTTGEAVTSLSKDIYKLGPGDVLTINVQGRSTINYKVAPGSADVTSTADSDKNAAPSPTGPNDVAVTSTGGFYIPLVGHINATGKTITQVENEIRTGLAKYFKHFTVDVSLSKARTLFVWVSGEVSTPGLLGLPATGTASLSALTAGVREKGSVRRIEVTRGGKHLTADLYRMLVLGDIASDFDLEPGDVVHVPSITKYVDVSGEVTRPGRYEMVTMDGQTDNFRVADLLQLCIGTAPTGMLSKAFIERIEADGQRHTIDLDLRDSTSSKDMAVAMQPGDTLVIPSIAAYQPMIRLIGEFKGSGLTQKTPGMDEADIENKSGIYFLKQGQTAGDIVRATGGVTPQADLKHAYIRRHTDGKAQDIPVDLERLLVKEDNTADITMQNGDYLVIPSMVDKVHVFGEVKSPGSYSYSPSRHVLDYLGDAGGPTTRAKLNAVRILRGTKDGTQITVVNLDQVIRGRKVSSDPTLEAGDIVYIPGKFIGSWQDAVQLVFTSLSLHSLLRNF